MGIKTVADSVVSVSTVLVSYQHVENFLPTVSVCLVW